MRILCTVNSKGGVGKTTIASSLAIHAANSGEKVAALDLDKSRSLLDLFAARDSDMALPPSLTVDGVTFEQMPKLPTILQGIARRGYTLVILDTQGDDNPGTHMAMQLADLCLMPVGPTGLDIRGSLPGFKALLRLGREASFVLNKCPAHINATKTKELAASLGHLGILAKPPLTLRTDYQVASTNGLGVTEYAPGSKAAEEITALWDWINKKMKAKP